LLNVGVIIKLEPDFSEGNVSYNSDGTLNRAETKTSWARTAQLPVMLHSIAR
jgi:hypothetical protein